MGIKNQTTGNRSFSDTFLVIPTISASPNYAAGDQIGGLQEINLRQYLGGQIVTEILIIDKADQTLDCDILFFDQEPTLGSSDNAALSISDSESEKIVGAYTMAGDWIDGVNWQIRHDRNINILLNSRSKDIKKVYALAVARGTYNADSTSSLVFKYKVLQD